MLRGQCRARHLKCGEERPDCQNCIKSRRKCIYKSEPLTDFNKVDSQLHDGSRWLVGADRFLVLLPGTLKERELVYAFCTRTARTLSGYSMSDLWCRLLPQLCYRESVVRHAVIALSAAYSQPQSSSRTSQDTDEIFVLSQYNKAIQGLRLLLSQPQGPGFNALLLTCVLFTGLEMLNGNEKRAFDHLESAMKILSNQLQRKASTKHNSVDHELSQVLYRLNIQLPYFGRPMIQLNMPEEKFRIMSHRKPLKFENIAQARKVMANLMQRSILLDAAIRMSGEDSPESRLPRQKEEQETLARETEIWHTAFTEMMQKPAKEVGILDPRAPWILWIEYHTGMVWIPCCTSREQVAYDKYLSHYEAVFHAAEQVVCLSMDTGPEPPGSKPFCLDTELLPMLYWTVTKCRYPLLRRKAISTLSRYTKQEGIWDARLYWRVLQRIMEIEERPLAFLPVEERMPAEEHRLHEVRIVPEKGVFTNPVVVFMRMKRDGVDGEWKSWFEYVQW